LRYVQRARKRAATTTGEATVALAEATTRAAVGSALGRVVTAAVDTATATTQAAAVLIGNDSAGAEAKVTPIAGQLGRLQAKNFKRRMNKLKVLSCPSI
jgi:hypothetical protein